MSARMMVVAAVLSAGLLSGCTAVKFVQKNPYTGEVWTVYQHTLASDSITYCPPIEGGACIEADFVDNPPPPDPNASPATPPPQPVPPQ